MIMRKRLGLAFCLPIGALLFAAGSSDVHPVCAQVVVDPRGNDDPDDDNRDNVPLLEDPDAIDDAASFDVVPLEEEGPAERHFDGPAPIRNQYDVPELRNEGPQYEQINDNFGEAADNDDDLPPWGGNPRVLGNRGVADNQYVDLELVPAPYVDLARIPNPYGQLELRPPDAEPAANAPNQYFAPEPAVPEERAPERQASIIVIIIRISPDAFNSFVVQTGGGGQGGGGGEGAGGFERGGGIAGWLSRVFRGPTGGGRNNTSQTGTNPTTTGGITINLNISINIDFSQMQPNVPDWGPNQALAANQYVDLELIPNPYDAPEPPPAE